MGDLTLPRARPDPHERGSKAGCGDVELTPGVPAPGAGERERGEPAPCAACDHRREGRHALTVTSALHQAGGHADHGHPG
jgi:hypothetical protein